MSLYIWREKYFSKAQTKYYWPWKNFKTFDKIRIDKIFLLLYNSPVNIRHKNDSRWCNRSLPLSVSGMDRSENPFLFFLLLWFNSKPLHILGLKQNTGAERNFLPRLFLLPEVCSGFFVLQFFLWRVVNILKTISILGVHLASPSPNRWGIVFTSKQEAQNIWKGVRKKFRTTNPTDYNYQTTKNAVLGSISINKQWIWVLASLLCYYLMRWH